MAHRRDIERLRGEIDELFADLWQIPRFTGLRAGFRPAIDCSVGDDPPRVTVVADLAGVDPAAVELLVTGRELVLTGERARPATEASRYEQMEILYGPFQRAVALPADVDVERAEARYERGLLVVTLPLAERPQAQAKVPIEVRARR
ncbi:MAG: Hsp20/alpha crystallin family protein [Actinomycetota bacterium]|nr:Hsp20/alpha crystallin family protein [Actinomycetota bacterium]